jgi:hypothetical protein
MAGVRLEYPQASMQDGFSSVPKLSTQFVPTSAHRKEHIAPGPVPGTIHKIYRIAINFVPSSLISSSDQSLSPLSSKVL